MELYRKLAQLVDAHARCVESKNDFAMSHRMRIAQLVETQLPHGSGFDNGTTLDLDASTSEKLVFDTAFHHMDGETGSYDGWTKHQVVIRASLAHGFTMRVAGENRNDIKDYIADVFNEALTVEVPNV